MGKMGNKCRIMLKKWLVEYYNFPEKEYIEPWLKQKKQETLQFILEIILSGIILHLVLFPLYSLLTYFTGYHIPIQLVPVFIISYGLMTFVVKETYSGITKGRKEVARSGRPR